MVPNIEQMSFDEKRKLLKELLEQESLSQKTLADFVGSRGRNDGEIKEFASWRNNAIKSGKYSLEIMRLGAPLPSIEIERQTGERYSVLNFSNYNYLGYATHPDVINAAKTALDKYGLGATASPLAAGMLDIHKEFEDTLLDFFGLEGYGITTFTSGFGALVGIISAYIHENDHIVSDSSSHASIIDGGITSRGNQHFFYHNDMEELEDILKKLDDGKNRILICAEGVYSADGDYGNIIQIVKLAKKYGAKTMIDEAHSMLLAGPNGKGACEEFGVLKEVDMIAGTFSKTFAGVGGFLFAQKDITDYVNIYARNRMFSCALDPAVTAGMTASLRLAIGEDGQERRKRIRDNADYFRSLLKNKVDIGESTTWIIPVIYGSEKRTMPIISYLQQEGLEGSILTYPGVPKNKARIRIFMTSEHTREQLEKAAEIILKAARKFDFLIN